MFLHRRLSTTHNRAFSVVSTTTDHDICAMAELMSPVVANIPDEFADAQDQLGVALHDELDILTEPSIYRENSERDLMNLRGYYTEFVPYTPPSPSSNRNSVCYDSDFDQLSDCNSIYLPKSAYPAFHLPRPHPTRPTTRDSDTPSLSSSTSFSSLNSVSRSQSRRSSPPVSPATLNTPIEYQSAGAPHLAIIEERNAEDQDISYRLSIETAGSPSSLPYLSSAHIEDPLRQHDLSIPKKRMPLLEHLKLSPASAYKNQLISPSLHSPALSSDSAIAGHFFGGGAKGDSAEARLQSAQSFSPSILSTATETPNKREERKRKAEEKKRQKAEAKAQARAKTQQLAMELKEIARERAAALERTSIRSGGSTGSAGRYQQYADAPSMFGGVDFFFGFS